MNGIHVVGDELQWGPIELASPVTGEVRIRVAAAGVNRADLVQRSGSYPPPKGASPLLGLEVAGVVEAVGPDAKWAVGDRVCALLAGGGYATHAVVHGDFCLPIPEGLELAHSAALPEVWATAWLNLMVLGEMRAGERVLLHAGASGVGTAGIQLCGLIGSRAFVTVGSEEKLQRCLALGAESGAVRHDSDWVQAVREWAGGVDLILDPVGGGYLEGAQRVLDVDGRWVLIGLMGGRSAPVDLGRLLMKRQRLIGSTLRALPHGRKAAVIRAIAANVWPKLAAGTIRPVIHQMMQVEDAAEAHALLASNDTVGKLVLTVPSGR